MTGRIAAQDRRWIALILLCVAQFVVVLDASIVNVALPTIGNALKFTESNLPWVVNAGVLTDGIGWQWVLWVNVPIGLIAAAIAPSLIAESRSEADRRHFDLAGAVSITAGLSVLVYALVDANNAGWGSAQTIGLLAAAT